MSGCPVCDFIPAVKTRLTVVADAKTRVGNDFAIVMIPCDVSSGIADFFLCLMLVNVPFA